MHSLGTTLWIQPDSPITVRTPTLLPSGRRRAAPPEPPPRTTPAHHPRGATPCGHPVDAVVTIPRRLWNTPTRVCIRQSSRGDGPRGPRPPSTAPPAVSTSRRHRDPRPHQHRRPLTHSIHIPYDKPERYPIEGRCPPTPGCRPGRARPGSSSPVRAHAARLHLILSTRVLSFAPAPRALPPRSPTSPGRGNRAIPASEPVVSPTHRARRRKAGDREVPGRA